MGDRVIAALWEFEVAAEQAAEFERQYGPNGAWARLFRRATGYVETTLLRDEARPGRYVTIDWWESAEAYDRFRAVHAAAYEALDTACEALTIAERRLGRFASVTRAP